MSRSTAHPVVLMMSISLGRIIIIDGFGLKAPFGIVSSSNLLASAKLRQIQLIFTAQKRQEAL